MLAGLFQDDHLEPSESLTADHVTYSDGAVIEYEPATGALKATGIKTALIDAGKHHRKFPCCDRQCERTHPPCYPDRYLFGQSYLRHPERDAGREMSGSFTHTGGTFSSNGVVIDDHNHGGVERGGSRTDGPK